MLDDMIRKLDQCVELIIKLNEKMIELDINAKCMGQVKFITIREVADAMGMSYNQAKKLFNDPEFPSTDYGKSKLVEESALRKYFAESRRKGDSAYWKNN